jgi:transcriptional regulator with XRE-family HTH domain
MAKKRKPTIRFSDEIREAVDSCGQSRYAISKATGLSESMLSRFMAGDRGLSMKALDVLAAYLDLHVATKQKRSS